MPYIMSTMSTSVDYVIYKKTPAGLPVIAETIHINGGCNVMNKHFITPDGVVTEVSDKELDMLKEHPVFKKHLEEKYVKIQSSEKVNKKGMKEKDKSAQLTKDDYKDTGLTVKSNKE